MGVVGGRQVEGMGEGKGAGVQIVCLVNRDRKRQESVKEGGCGGEGKPVRGASALAQDIRHLEWQQGWRDDVAAAALGRSKERSGQVAAILIQDPFNGH